MKIASVEAIPIAASFKTTFRFGTTDRSTSPNKPTGAAVGHQPFGGARGSGTNDKVGTMWNLIRVLNMRAVKRTHVLDRNPNFPTLD